MNLDSKQLKTFSSLNRQDNKHNHGGKLYLLEGKLYKIFSSISYFEDEVERNIDFQRSHRIPNTPVIYDKVFIDGVFSGYVMEYIENSNTIRNLIGQKINLEIKLRAIRDIYNGLKYLHSNNIFLGDVHSENFLINSDGRGFIIDLDYMVFVGDEYKFTQCYLIKPNSKVYKINISSRYTDNVKVMLVCLSLLLGINLEEFISPTDHSINLEDIYNNVIVKLNNNDLNEYFLRVMAQEDVDYFIDFIDKHNLYKTDEGNQCAKL